MENGIAPAENRLTLGHSRRSVDKIGALIHPITLAGGRIDAMEFVIVAAD